MPDTILQTKDLSKQYGDRWAVNKLNLTVNRGEVFGFLGPNGAGKTTTIRMMLGLIKPTSGTVLINGYDIQTQAMEALGNVGAIVETPAFYGYLSARENLVLLGRISGGVPPERIDETLDLVGLLPRAGDKVRGYSQGMRQRLGIAQALLARPKIVLLDEPTNGLDPSGMIEIRRLIKKLAESYGITVFISSHLLHEIEATCTRVAVINSGTLVAEGPVDHLVEKENICLEIMVSDTARAIDIIKKLNLSADKMEASGSIELNVGRERVAEINRRLVEGGVDVMALVPRESSLEDFFLELTGGASGDRASTKGAEKNVR